MVCLREWAEIVQIGCQPVPNFSIVTVTLNNIQGLVQTWESLQSQGFHKWEWIVIDGASSDGTVEYLASIEDLRLKWLSDQDNGIYDAMNKGIQLATGEFTVFMNSSDVFSSSNVLTEVEALKASSICPLDLIFGAATLCFPNGRRVRRPARRIESTIWHGLPANHQASFFRTQRIRFTNYDASYRICGDYYLVASLFKEGVKCDYLDLSLVDFEVGGLSYSNPRSLFFEPYRIQKDILSQPAIIRIVSFLRRAIATFATVFLKEFGRGK